MNKLTAFTTTFGDMHGAIFGTNQFESNDTAQASFPLNTVGGNALKEFEKHCIDKGFKFEREMLRENEVQIKVSRKNHNH